MDRANFVKRNLLFVFVSFVMMIFSCSGVRGYTEGEVIPEEDYLTFVADKGETAKITFSSNEGDIQYKKNNGGWSDPIKTKIIISLDRGDSVKFRGNGIKTVQGSHFEINDPVSVRGCVDSLRVDDEGKFQGLGSFNCYSYMFKDCQGLMNPPKLSATELKNGCYSNMFEGCTNLEYAPELPATKLEENCYSNMFQRCTKLKYAPKLPATQLAPNCYKSMFYDCTDLNLSKEKSDTHPYEWKFKVGDSTNYDKMFAVREGATKHFDKDLNSDDGGYLTIYSSTPLVWTNEFDKEIKSKGVPSLNTTVEQNNNEPSLRGMGSLNSVAPIQDLQMGMVVWKEDDDVAQIVGENVSQNIMGTDSFEAKVETKNEMTYGFVSYDENGDDRYERLTFEGAPADTVELLVPAEVEVDYDGVHPVKVDGLKIDQEYPNLRELTVDVSNYLDIMYMEICNNRCLPALSKVVIENYDKANRGNGIKISDLQDGVLNEILKQNSLVGRAGWYYDNSGDTKKIIGESGISVPTESTEISIDGIVYVKQDGTGKWALRSIPNQSELVIAAAFVDANTNSLQKVECVDLSDNIEHDKIQKVTVTNIQDNEQKEKIIEYARSLGWGLSAEQSDSGQMLVFVRGVNSFGSIAFGESKTDSASSDKVLKTTAEKSPSDTDLSNSEVIDSSSSSFSNNNIQSANNLSSSNSLDDSSDSVSSKESNSSSSSYKESSTNGSSSNNSNSSSRIYGSSTAKSASSSAKAKTGDPCSISLLGLSFLGSLSSCIFSCKKD